jgi:hypothetical protein
MRDPVFANSYVEQSSDSTSEYLAFVTTCHSLRLSLENQEFSTQIATGNETEQRNKFISHNFALLHLVVRGDVCSDHSTTTIEGFQAVFACKGRRG